MTEKGKSNNLGAMKTLFTWLACAAVALADPIKFPKLKVNGKEYTNVVVTAVEADGIKITHAAGISRIPFEQLDEEVKKIFGVDEELLRSIRERAAAEKAGRAQAAKIDKAASKISEALLKSRICITGNVLSVGAKGLLLTDVTYNGKWSDQNVIVKGKYNSVDGDRVMVNCWPVGNMQYTSVLGAERTVRAFTQSPDEFMKFAGWSSKP